MPAQLSPMSLGMPSYYGLNKEAETSVLGPEWATEVDNMVFDSSGRLAARQGWDADYSVAAGDVKALIQMPTGTIISAVGLKLYAGASDVTGTITTPTDDYWNLQIFNSKCIGFQDNHSPIIYTGSTFSNLSVTHGGAMPTTWSGVALSAFGRLWAVDEDKQVIKYSALLDETDFDASVTLSDATAGLIDLTSVWRDGHDEIVALAAFNGQLVVFGKRSILVYSNPSLPYSEMALVDTTSGVGCIARDSVQAVGDDLFFLSVSGIRSLKRTVIKDKMPLTDISKNVRTWLSGMIGTAEFASQIKSAYSERYGFYMLSIPSADTTLIVDIRNQLPDGSYRITTWSSLIPTAIMIHQDNRLYFGMSGKVGYYNSYQDDGSSYAIAYKSGWMSMSEVPILHIMKYMRVIAYTGTTNTITMNWQFDFNTTEKTASKTLSGTIGSEYGTALYGVDEWAGGGSLVSFRIPMKGHGELFKAGFDLTVNGYEFSIQKIDLFAKKGRIV